MLQGGKGFLNILDNIHGIVTGLLLDNNLGAAGAVGVGFLGLFFQAVLNAGNVLEIYGAAAAVANHNVQKFLRVFKLLLDSEGIGVGAYVYASGRDVAVLLGDGT